MANEIDKLLKADKEKKLITGFRESLRAVKLGQAKEVFATRNCSEPMKRQLKEAVQLSKAELVELAVNGEELSAQIKKPYNITVAAIALK